MRYRASKLPEPTKSGIRRLTKRRNKISSYKGFPLTRISPYKGFSPLTGLASRNVQTCVNATFRLCSRPNV